MPKVWLLDEEASLWVKLNMYRHSPLSRGEGVEEPQAREAARWLSSFSADVEVDTLWLEAHCCLMIKI